MKFLCNYKSVDESPDILNNYNNNNSNNNNKNNLNNNNDITIHVNSQQQSSGSITILDQTQFLHSRFKDENSNNSNINDPNYNNKISRNSKNIKRKNKMEIALIRIPAIKQQRAQFQDIKKRKQRNQEQSLNIICRVFDENTINDFKRMCQYYAFNDNNTNIIYSKPLSNFHSQNNYVSTSLVPRQKNTHTKHLFQSNKDQDYSNNQEHYQIYPHHSNNTLKTEKQLKTKSFEFKLNEKQQNPLENTSSNNRRLFQIQCNSELEEEKSKESNKLVLNFQNSKLVSNSVQQYTENLRINQLNSEIFGKNTHNQCKSQTKSQILKLNSQSRKILYDSSVSDSPSTFGNLCLNHQKTSLKNDFGNKIEYFKQAEYNKNRSKQIQNKGNKKLKEDEKQIIKCSSSENESKVQDDQQGERIVLMEEKRKQNCWIKQESTDELNDNKLELQQLILNPADFCQNSLTDTISIFQKCIILTQASYTHSILSNLFLNFDNFLQIQDINEPMNIIQKNDKVKHVYNDEYNQILEGKREEEDNWSKQKCDSIQSRIDRTSTIYSKSSATTQPSFGKPSSDPSLTNIPECSSVCCHSLGTTEIVKIDSVRVCENINSENLQIKNVTNEKDQEKFESQYKSIYQFTTKMKEEEEEEEIKKSKKQKNMSESKNVQTGDQKNYTNFIDLCKNFFQLKNLSEQQLYQFKFSHYKKKNNTITSVSAGLSNKINPFNQINNNSISEYKDDNINEVPVSKFGKFHNYNKLFMYNILNMFQANNMENLNVPDFISKELQLLISRIKQSAKNNYKIEGKYAFDYFSHAHYNVLFLKLTQENINILAQQEEYVTLYSECFKINLNSPISESLLAYVNLVKLFCYLIFTECIQEKNIKVDNSLNQKNFKNQYTLKVIKGIKKLTSGVIIKRF